MIGRPELPELAYEARLTALLKAGMGLWDVARSAQRTGSLDTALRDVECNDLAELLGQLPRLAAIGFNGAAAARIGRKLLSGSTFPLVDLQSSSAAHCRITIAEKRKDWMELARHLPRKVDRRTLQSPPGAPDWHR